VFIEVRTKRSREFGSPEESVTPVKREKLRTLAARYCQEHPEVSSSWRIDVVAVEVDRSSRPVRLELIQNAVGEE
jgi:putative endonuclease